jgi:hypothetical protein
MTDFQTILTAVGTIGFPITITIYIIVKLNSTIEKLSELIKEVSIQNKIIIQALNGRSFPNED